MKLSDERGLNSLKSNDPLGMLGCGGSICTSYSMFVPPLMSVYVSPRTCSIRHGETYGISEFLRIMFVCSSLFFRESLLIAFWFSAALTCLKEKKADNPEIINAAIATMRLIKVVVSEAFILLIVCNSANE